MSHDWQFIKADIDCMAQDGWYCPKCRRVSITQKSPRCFPDPDEKLFPSKWDMRLETCEELQVQLVMEA